MSKVKKHAVQLSKSLSFILRHGANKYNLNIRPDGYVLVQELLHLPQFKAYTLEDIQEVVRNNDKQRFTLSENIPEAEEEGKWWIRANQGHSMKEIDRVEMSRISSAEEIPVAVHGTYLRHWESIRTQGLSKMNRNHIHLAAGLPGDGQVISGMRRSCELYIYVDLEKAMENGVEFYRSANDVILTSGVGGLLSPSFFKRVIIAKTGQQIWPN